MEASSATCPKRLILLLPLFSTSTITYVQWYPKSNDLTPLHLHRSPPPVKINRTGNSGFDDEFQHYDSQLRSTIKKADSMIDQIEETRDTSYVAYIAFTALGLSVVNLVVFGIA